MRDNMLIISCSCILIGVDVNEQFLQNQQST